MRNGCFGVCVLREENESLRENLWTPDRKKGLEGNLIVGVLDFGS